MSIGTCIDRQRGEKFVNSGSTYFVEFCDHLRWFLLSLFLNQKQNDDDNKANTVPKDSFTYVSHMKCGITLILNCIVSKVPSA